MTIKIPKWLILCIVAFFLSSGSRLVNDLFEFSKNLEIFSAVYKEVGDKYVDEVPPGKLANTPSPINQFWPVGHCQRLTDEDEPHCAFTCCEEEISKKAKTHLNT